MTNSDRLRTRPRRLTSVAPYLALLALSSGCSGSDPVSPERRLAGRYDAIIWTIVSVNGTIDMLAEGSHLWIELKPDGTTDGEFFTPEGAAPQPPERTVSMEGAWSVTGDDVVTFVMDGDTYVQQVEWQFGADKLESEFSVGGYTTTTILRR
jgi:hypothetical protein